MSDSHAKLQADTRKEMITAAGLAIASQFKDGFFDDRMIEECGTAAVNAVYDKLVVEALTSARYHLFANPDDANDLAVPLVLGMHIYDSNGIDCYLHREDYDTRVDIKKK